MSGPGWNDFRLFAGDVLLGILGFVLLGAFIAAVTGF